MSKIDVSDWKEFHLYDLFEINSGSKLDRKDINLVEGDEYNYIGRTGDNNGIIGKCGYVHKKNKEPYPAGSLTVSLGGTVGATFVQPKAFYTSQNVDVLLPLHKMSDKSKFFIASCIYREAELNYSAFIKELNAHIRKDFYIKLPVASTGEPNWDYMDEYIEKLATQARKNVSSLATLKPVEHKIDIKAWKEFEVEELFDVRPSKYVKQNGKTLINAELFDNGDHKVIVNTSMNNGIGGYTSQDFTEKGNVITFSDTTDGPSTMFYQDQPFVGYSHVKVMEPKEFIKDSKKVLLYLTATIRKALRLNDYNFTNKLTTQAINNTTVKLPVTSTGQPDFDYMETCIDSMQNEAHESLEVLKQI